MYRRKRFLRSPLNGDFDEVAADSVGIAFPAGVQATLGETGPHTRSFSGSATIAGLLKNVSLAFEEADVTGFGFISARKEIGAPAQAYKLTARKADAAAVRYITNWIRRKLEVQSDQLPTISMAGLLNPARSFQ